MTHFYGELASTGYGARVLNDSGHMSSLLMSLKGKDMPVSRRRAAVMALGEIGHSAHGLSLLMSADNHILSEISHIANADPCLSLRGIALNALRMITATPKGAALVKEMGWAFRKKEDGFTAIVIPLDIDRFFNLDHVEDPVDLGPKGM